MKMSPGGRCELVDFQVHAVEFSSHDPLLWLKATSVHLDAVALRFRKEMPAGFAIPGHVALAKYLKIPQGPRGKRKKIISFEARQNIPYPIEEVTWNHALVEEDELDFDVLIGATRTEVVETIARYCKEAEIRLKCVEPSTTGLINGFRFNYPEVVEPALILSIGAKSTDLIFVEKGRYHSRNVPFGGQAVTLEIAEALNVPTREAEQVKLSAIAGEPLASEAFAAFEAAEGNFIARLATEVSRTAAVLKRQGFAFEPGLCYLTGGGSLLPALQEGLAQRLAMRTQAFDPARKIVVMGETLEERVEAAAPLLADAIGLAIGQYLPDAVSVDLTPRSLVWSRKFRRQQPFYLLAGLIACAAVGLPILNTMLEIRTYQQELFNLEVQIRPLSERNQEIHARAGQIRRLAETIEQLKKVGESKPSWMLLLNDLQSRLVEVEDVWIDKLRLERPEGPAPTGRGQPRVRRVDERTKLRVAGRLIDVYNPVSNVSPDSYERVKTLLESLRESVFVESLEGERFDYSVPGILGFDFTLVVTPEARL